MSGLLNHSGVVESSIVLSVMGAGIYGNERECGQHQQPFGHQPPPEHSYQGNEDLWLELTGSDVYSVTEEEFQQWQ